MFSRRTTGAAVKYILCSASGGILGASVLYAVVLRDFDVRGPTVRADSQTPVSPSTPVPPPPSSRARQRHPGGVELAEESDGDGHDDDRDRHPRTAPPARAADDEFDPEADRIKTDQMFAAMY